MQNKHFSFSNMLKDGIFLLLPFGISLGLIYWAWGLMRGFIPDLSIIFPASLIQHPNFSQFLDLIYLFVIMIFIILFGILASTVLGRFFSAIIEKILMKPTFIRPIYTTFKKLAESVFQQNNSDSFAKGISESLLIPYPNKETKSIGFVTSTHAKHFFGEKEGTDWLTVYVPSAPVISAGFYLICRKKDTEPCKLPSGQAMTTIISVGANQSSTPIPTDFSPIEESSSKKNLFQTWFVNGLLFLTPITATIYILGWIFNQLYIFIARISFLIPEFSSIDIPQPYYNILLNIVIALILLLIIAIIGLLGETAFGIWVKSLSQKIFNSIPMLNKVYSIVEQITKVFSPDPSKSNTFDKAVLIPFPTDATYAIGFITGENSNYLREDGNNYIPVFVPTTPIPTTGWFMTVEANKLKPLDMPIEQAFGLVISAGIIAEDK